MMRNRKGFTLLELLIVVAIIAILAGVLVPSLSRAKAIARRAVCRTNLHAVAVGMRMYLDENKDIMPVAAQMPSVNVNDPRIADVLKPYLANPETLKCPADIEKNYFIREGSSYEYQSMLGGREVRSRSLGETNTPVMNDYEPFHGQPDTSGATNYLFADGRVGDLE